MAELLARAVGATRPANLLPDGGSSIAGGLGAAARRATSIQEDIDRRAFAAAADLLDLGSRRPDLTSTQRSELYRAGTALLGERASPTVAGSEIPSEQIFAWIDVVHSITPWGPNAPTTMSPAERELLPGMDPLRLLLGPEPGVMAGELAALARRRPDLSAAQRHELYLGARVHLARGYGRRAQPPSLAAVDAWIDLVAPVRGVSATAPPAHTTPTMPARAHRALGLADPPTTFHRALIEAINLGEDRLSKTAIAARMGIDRKTLARYIAAGLIPPPPWELLAAELSGRSPSR